MVYHSSNLSLSDAHTFGKYDLYDANNLIGKTNINSMKHKYISVIKDGAGVGKIRILPENTYFISTMGALLPKNSDVNFCYALLNRFPLSVNYSGSTIPHIYFKDYGNNIYLLPKLKEQYEIGIMFEKINSLISLHHRKHFLVIFMKKLIFFSFFQKFKKR